MPDDLATWHSWLLSVQPYINQDIARWLFVILAVLLFVGTHPKFASRLRRRVDLSTLLRFGRAKEPEPPPRLLAGLYVESPDPDPPIRVVVENVGTTPIVNLRVGFTVPGGAALASTEYAEPRDLIHAGSRVALLADPLGLDAEKNRTVSVTLSYEAGHGGAPFTTRLRFTLPRGYKPNGPLDPVSLVQVEGAEFDTDVLPDVLQNFSNKVGTLCLTLPEYGPDGSQRYVHLSNNRRQLVFDPHGRRVWFSSTAPDGTTFGESLPLRSRDDRTHKVAAGWDDFGITLAVDGKSARDPKNRDEHETPT